MANSGGDLNELQGKVKRAYLHFRLAETSYDLAGKTGATLDLPPPWPAFYHTLFFRPR